MRIGGAPTPRHPRQFWRSHESSASPHCWSTLGAKTAPHFSTGWTGLSSADSATDAETLVSASDWPVRSAHRKWRCCLMLGPIGLPCVGPSAAAAAADGSIQEKFGGSPCCSPLVLSRPFLEIHRGHLDISAL